MKTITGFVYYPDSIASAGDVLYFLARSEEGDSKMLGVLGDDRAFEEGFIENGSGALLCPLTPSNAALLRQRLPWLRPQAWGLQPSAGFGDRLGLATPGHVKAVHEAQAKGVKLAPIFAQQSVRENQRTHRTPQQVLDDATWGVFQTGWRSGWGADADHLKTTEDVNSFCDAGFTFFTIDPGDVVDNAAQEDSPDVLRTKALALPWDTLQGSLPDLLSLYRDRTFQVDGFTIRLDEISLLRALAKYGRAIAHSANMAAHLKNRMGATPYDLEVSVDETATPTSPEEHFFIASELRRLGVNWVSLAPRFVGRFEKGVDYIGDLQEFEDQFAQHAAIARQFGNYRLSLHSGSDKFSIYAIAARLCDGLLHLKTAGTSYLEALRVIAQVNPALFRHIYQLALERYSTDRASYHVSGKLENMPAPTSLPDADLPSLLDQFDARQAFHVTFGAALEQMGTSICSVISENEDVYYDFLAAHFMKHLLPLQPLAK